ncbi:ProQ/FinO family protein [Ensifer sesbaniae]|nr:ProQ/FinO family protein [Ensifer sesbaniae]
MRSDVSVSTLRKATGAYIHSRSYQIAVARRDSHRHDINGVPIDFVPDADRLDAQQVSGCATGSASQTHASLLLPLRRLQRRK